MGTSRRDADEVHVTQVQRRAQQGQVSIERVFETVRAHLPEDVHVRVRTSGHRSAGVLPRLRGVLEARRLQSQVTHVTGDVHYLTLLMRRRSTVLTVHDTEFLDRASGMRAALYTWLWLRLPVLRSGSITVPSEGTRRDLIAVLGRDPGIDVVPNPLLPGFAPTPPVQRTGPPVVLLMGTWPTKNLPRSAAALRGLPVQVVVVGPLDEAQRGLLDEAVPGWVHHLGLDAAGVVEVIRSCDLLLFPSLREGFGLPVIEAQASGRPVVTSDRSPLREVAGDGGACLVDPEDVPSIRAGVQRVLDDPAYRDELVRNGLRNVQRFDPAAVAARYAAVYRAAAAR